MEVTTIHVVLLMCMSVIFLTPKESLQFLHNREILAVALAILVALFFVDSSLFFMMTIVYALILLKLGVIKVNSGGNKVVQTPLVPLPAENPGKPINHVVEDTAFSIDGNNTEESYDSLSDNSSVYDNDDEVVCEEFLPVRYTPVSKQNNASNARKLHSYVHGEK
jgi:hypothetical protein